MANGFAADLAIMKVNIAQAIRKEVDIFKAAHGITPVEVSMSTVDVTCVGDAAKVYMVGEVRVRFDL
jgi:hypothetical protein